MTGIIPCAVKTHAVLAKEWDRIAEERNRQISSGEDISFDYVVAPTTLSMFEGADPELVLEIGTGTGHFTTQLAQVAKRVIGVEPSFKSIGIAREICHEQHNVWLIQNSLEATIEQLRQESVTAAVACMTLMTTPQLSEIARSLAILLPKEAKFIAIISHPCFWPRYWGYESEDWFNYSHETFIEAPFVISRRKTVVKTTHVHRPIEHYVKVFAQSGFRLDSLVEPMPSAEVQRLYPQPWQFPRFLGLQWTKST